MKRSLRVSNMIDAVLLRLKLYTPPAPPPIPETGLPTAQDGELREHVKERLSHAQRRISRYERLAELRKRGVA